MFYWLWLFDDIDDSSLLWIAASLSFLFFGIFLVGILFYNDYDNKYEYIDVNGNSGIAERCNKEMKCELEDGTIIKVNQYKEIRNEG